MESGNELDFDTDAIKSCLWAVCVTGLNKDGTKSDYFKTLRVFSDSEVAIMKAWCVGSEGVKDRSADMKQFLVPAEEAVESDAADEYDFVGTIFKTELIA